MVDPLHCSQLSVHGVEVELLRVELAADPFHHFGVALVIRVADRFQKVTIAPDASHILRWTRSRPFDAAGVRNIRLWFQDFLKEDLMLPTVSEVILVNEPDLPSPLGNLADRKRLLTDLHQTITRLYVVLVWLEVASCRV